MKLQARLSESQAMIEQLTLKLAQLEKAKAKSATDAADMAQQLDQVFVEYLAELGMKCLRSIHIDFQAQILMELFLSTWRYPYSVSSCLQTHTNIASLFD